MGFVLAVIIFMCFGLASAKDRVETGIKNISEKALNEQFEKIKLSEEEERSIADEIRKGDRYNRTGPVARVRDFVWGKFDMKYAFISNGYLADETIITMESVKKGKISGRSTTNFPDLKVLVDFDVTAKERIEFEKWLQDELVKNSGTEARIAYNPKEDVFTLTCFYLKYKSDRDILIDDPKIYDVVKGVDEAVAKEENISKLIRNRYDYNCHYYGEEGTKLRKKKGLRYKF